MNVGSTWDAVDLFAGPGGWDVAAQRLGLKVIGLEFEKFACQTRRAYGLETVEGDVRAYGPADFPADGLIASPPCQTFSQAGKGEGRAALDVVLGAIEAMEWGTELGMAIRHGEATDIFSDERTALVLEPLRWAMEAIDLGSPYQWMAFEQVSTVLPVWKAMAKVLYRLGYDVTTGLVQAEQYGVPQTRKRAVLLAHLDKVTGLPAPTHSKYHNRTPKRLDADVLPWVSMAEALGYTDDVNFSSWAFRRPSTTVVGSFAPEIQAAPGYRKAGDGPRQNAPGSIRTTVKEASTLQSFPRDYPWAGPAGKVREQIGNAVPPGLAQAILAEVAT